MSADTPSALLSRAADLIRDTAAAATPGPWFTHDTHLNPGGHTATVLSGTYPEGQLRAWLPTWSHEPWDETRNVWNDARWIALMSPEVAGPVSEMLRRAASDYVVFVAAWESRPRPEGEVARLIEEQFGGALALARAVLGEKEETDDR